MNNQDKKILELYIKDKRKRKLICLCIFLFLVVSITFYGIYIEYNQPTNEDEIENIITEDIETNIINTNTANEESIIEREQNKVEENRTEEGMIEKNTEVEKNETTKEKNVQANKQEKPANKDFLFTEGYNMENVTQVAQEYLKSFDFSGECIPIKDDEGVYLGMRVIFY